MNFNDIKNTWRNSYKDKILSEEQLSKRLMIKDRSNSAIHKLKKSYKFEFIVGGAEYIVIVAGLYYFLDVFTASIFLLIVSLLMGVSFYFAGKAYSIIRNTNYTDDNLKQALKKTTSKLNKFLKFAQNHAIKFIQIPFALIVGVTMGLFIASNFIPDKDFIDIINSMKTRTIIKIISVVVIGSGIMIPFSIYWSKKRFAQYIEKLKESLKELEETEKTNI